MSVILRLCTGPSSTPLLSFLNYLKANLMLLILFYSDQLFFCLFCCQFHTIKRQSTRFSLPFARSKIMFALLLEYFGYHFEAFVCVCVCDSCHVRKKDEKGKNFDRISLRSLI